MGWIKPKKISHATVPLTHNLRPPYRGEYDEEGAQQEEHDGSLQSAPVTPEVAAGLHPRAVALAAPAQLLAARGAIAGRGTHLLPSSGQTKVK